MSVGGSLVVPNGEIDVVFLKGFKRLVNTHIKKGWKFVIVVGGGGTCRHYQRSAERVTKLTREDLDWLGIHATRLNGHLMRTIFRDVAHPEMFNDPKKIPLKWKQSVLIGAGWRPGWSTDYVATTIAKRLGARVVINLSNIDYLFDKDPKKHKNAQPIYDITWKDFRSMVGDKWDPGMNVPFDPVASKLAQSSGIKVAILNGKKMKNIGGLLKGERFIGTVIGG